jgi:hypothetical protein
MADSIANEVSQADPKSIPSNYRRRNALRRALVVLRRTPVFVFKGSGLNKLDFAK